MSQDEIISTQFYNKLSFFSIQYDYHLRIQLDFNIFHKAIVFPSGVFFNKRMTGAPGPALPREPLPRDARSAEAMSAMRDTTTETAGTLAEPIEIIGRHMDAG